MYSYLILKQVELFEISIIKKYAPKRHMSKTTDVQTKSIYALKTIYVV
jgi:hypothetical protein